MIELDEFFAIAAQVESISNGLISTLHVLESCDSTQDFAKTLGAGHAVVTQRQLRGRGRLGRTWADTGDMGLAMTFVLDGRQIRDDVFSLACGLASVAACLEHLPKGACGLGLRWPNDVVTRTHLQGSQGQASEAAVGRKLSGVLIERCGGCVLAGIGINVAQTPEMFEGTLATTATSLAILGAKASRPAVARSLVSSLSRVLKLDAVEVARQWSELDVLLGTHRRFMHDGKVTEGIVQAIYPLGEIEVVTVSGERVVLPAISTSLIHA